FSNSYFGAWRCEVCSSETNYIFGNDQDACSSFGNWQFTFFDFVPNDYSNPCNSGGTLTIMDFDDNGTAIIHEVEVPANSAIAELPGLQPFGSSLNTWCKNSGWCLFDALDVYGFSMDKPLLATWAQEESCEEIVWDDPTTPNPDPCQSDNDCPPGFVCVDGNCYQECPDGECLYGVCIEGICVESPECEPSCPPGYQCIEGDCYLNEEICGFYEEVNGGSGINTYNFYHDLAPGTVIQFSYNTLTREDEIFISGSGIQDHIPCVGTNGWQTVNYTITGGHAITITVSPCQSGSKYHFSITCEGALRNGPPINRGVEDKDEEKIVIYPNPFVSSIDIKAFNIASPFDGQILLFDNLGREILRKEVAFEAGDNSLNIDGLEHLSTGVYLVMVRKRGEVCAFRKVVKVE
ncbi:MAG: T9SS type A sorting domain-containing protein, partial [Phaeodactylibacter sp.]|nr:T9SS type A sorting domain-containing protein [Phaeodactylibacter sp.]